MPAYRDLPPEEQRAARQKYLDVCDQIMFHLLVVKRPIDEAEVQQIAAQMHCYDPPFTQIRRLRESNERQEQHVRILPETVAKRDAELTDLRTVLDTREKEWQATLEVTQSELQTVRAAAEQELQNLRTEKEEQEEARKRTVRDLAQVQSSLVTSQQTTTLRGVELEHTRVQVAMLQQRLGRVGQYQQSAVAELRSFRRHRENRWRTRFRPGGDLRDQIAPAFQQLKDDSLLFTRTLKGFRLQPSTDLQAVPFLAYPLNVPRPGLSGVLLAPVLDFPVEEGRFGIEIVSPANAIVAQVVVPFTEVDVQVPTSFRFAPINDSHQGRFWLRVFVRDATDPVRIFEWRKYRYGGFGSLQTRAFCGFLFT
ncbi:MAG: hypothetical protein FJ147_25925 [Deltaproteobacteria bacterium]|nr:hypothetical protein [Deltaproteobacteria bacterium]